MRSNVTDNRLKRNSKSGSLYRKLFYYFLAFTVIFIALLWILQVFTLNYSYKSSRLNDIMKTGRQVKAEISDEDSADEIIEDLSIDRDTAIVLYDTSSGSIITKFRRSVKAMKSSSLRRETIPCLLLYVAAIFSIFAFR